MKHLILSICCLFVQFLFAHGHHDHAAADLKKWQISTESQLVEASFLMFKDGEVFLEEADGQVAHFPLAAFSEADQAFVQQRYAQIERLNQPAAQPAQPRFSSSQLALFGLLALALGGCVLWVFGKKRWHLSWAVMLALAATCYGFKPVLFGTDPAFIDSAFQPFKPAVYTRWDANWFYVESKGIPDHEMMRGITKWQQQVPIPQCYIGSNAWQIPLNPVLAATPVPVNPQHFLRGAVAIAANGVPIFNPYTNTGVDAYVDGQLDVFGGHSGRADDYHYHTAPLHLDAKTTDILPIAFALDGFAVYASLEPNGSPMAALDANHGHFGADGVYHYHGTAAAPYMIGNMVGQVTEDATMQIIPQAAAKPVRPSLTPLTGATITGCVPNAANNGYTLTYTRNGQVFSVEYSWTPTGKYTYNFISPTSTTTEVYNGAAPCTVPTATEEVFDSKQAVAIFPNPATSGFTLKWADDIAPSEVQGVSVFDSAGKLVFENQGFAADLTVRNLPQGVYVVRVQFQKEQITQKLVIQNFSMKILLLTLLAVLAVPTFGQTLPKTMLRLPDTGQTASFTSTTGEDSDYSINPPFFIKNGDGTATDTVTGLIWQQTDGGEMTYENAILYCLNLNLGGSSDWRLPTAQEAYSILNHSKPNPALDGTVFAATGAEYWWTSEPEVNSSTKVWVTNAGGGVGNHLKSETISAGGTKKIHVRAVRDAKTPPTIAAQFTDNADGSVTDHLTNLVWQKVPLADTLNWEQALNYAENLTLAGKSDWRLPNIKELQSINDESRSNPSVNTAFFSTIGVKKYWSSTSLPNQPMRAWYLDTRFGITTYDLKARRLSLICVRGPEKSPPTVEDRRNVILIIADDLGTDYCGFYENHLDTAAMPNVRRLLSRGVRFRRAWSNPLCSPTRAGILTGRYSFRTGVGDAIGGTGAAVLDTSEITIPRLLNKYAPNAIAKANIGKWHLHNPTPASNLLFPTQMGYDFYTGNFIGQLTNYYNWKKVVNGANTDVTNYATTETANDAISWVKTQQNKPFFLWLAFNAPHTPLHLPPAGLHSYTTLSGTAADIAANPKPYFKASVEALDHEIGRLFDSLVVYHLWDSTDIIFIGDNGDDPAVAQYSGSAKGSIYQQGVSVPFIISGPSVLSPNRTSDALVNTQDLFATILELFGNTQWRSQIPANKPVDSKSILPILKNQATDIRPWIFTEVFKVPTVAGDGKAMRNGDYKLLDFDNGTQKFFNLTTDPLENTNLLTATLNPVQLSNYNYLCNEMTALVSAGGFCSPTVGTSEAEQGSGSLGIYPNPFSSHIFLKNAPQNATCELSNAFGQPVFLGKNLEQQDFSELPSGVYFLKIMGRAEGVFRLLKA